MSSGLYSGVSGIALGTGLYRNVSGLWGGASGLVTGFGGGGQYDGASLYLDFLTPPLDSRITFSRGSNATLVDSTGKVTYAPANLLTYSQQFDNAIWIKNASASVAGGVADPFGGSSAFTFTATGTSASVQQSPTLSAISPIVGSIWIRRRTGTGVISLRVGDATQIPITVTTTWTRVSEVRTPSTTTARLAVLIADTGDVVDIYGAQLEQVTYQTTPSTYVATTASAYYGPRFDYDPVTLAPRGLLIEEARTNLLTYSEQFDNAAWVKTDTTVTANATASPDGTVNAELLTEGSAGTAQIGRSATITGGAAITASFHLKRGSTDWVRIQVVNGSDFFRLWVNLSTGAIGTTAAGGAGTYTSSSTRAMGNGWYRITVSGTIPTSPASMFVNTASADNSSTRVSGGTYFAWGAQLETGAFATSYIPTVASTVTRSADVATMTGTNFSSWYNQSEGTFVAEADQYAAASYGLVAASDGTASNYVMLDTTSSGNSRYRVAVGGVSQAAIVQASAIVPNAVYKVAATYQANSFQAAYNGTLGTEDTSGTLPTVDRLLVGATTSGTPLNGHIRAIAYYNTRLPNAQLQTLTAPALVTSLALDFISPSYTVGY